MAVETRVLVNGEWVTRTVGLDDVLRRHEEQDAEAGHTAMQLEKTPIFGMLTQTVIQSPLVHHILPIRLRGLDFNDVAFIGEEFVQIKELRADGFLWDLARKENFGARIRNARVVGSIEDYENDPDVVDTEDVDMSGSRRAMLPPQFLLLQLDTGDSVFLMLQQTGPESFEFIITGQHRVPRTMLGWQPGMHLSVDPSSRYMAVACSESHFTVYALRSREQLKSQHAKGLSLQHILVDAYLPFQGTIQKMEFLYPSGEGNVMLLILVIFKGRTRMVLYEWQLGDDIRKIRSLNRKGHMLAPAHQMPLLLIPLKFKSTFILVSENIMAHFQNILEGEPLCTEFYDHVDRPTELHHGSGPPLWVGWARPTNRTRDHNDRRDDIYIAREDGLLKFLEIDCDEFVESDMNVGEFEGRCGTALACIDYKDLNYVTGDLLITGGDSCTGGAYLVQARETPRLIQPIENWTPAQDFFAMSTEQSQPGQKSKSKNSREIIHQPDRIFACVGQGSRGMIAEFRYGLEARIGLHFDFESPIMQAWSLPFSRVAYGDADGTLFILSVGQSSVALHLSGNETTVETVVSDMTALDLEHHTIDIKQQDDRIIQVTEKSVVLIDSFGSKVFEGAQLFHVQEDAQSVGLGSTIYNAVVDGSSVLYTTIIENKTYLLSLELPVRESNRNSIDLEQDSKTLGQFSARVTSLATFSLDGTMLVIVAEWLEDTSKVTISFQPTGSNSVRTILDLTHILNDDHINIKVEAIESVVAVVRGEKLVLLCGTRNGVLLMLDIDLSTFEILGSEQHRLGASSVSVRRDEARHSQELFLANCDGNAFALTFNAFHSGRGLGPIHTQQIWFTDAINPELPQPGINSIAGHVPSFGNDISYDRLLVVAGSQILLTFLDTEAKAVPRYLKIGGTPTRIIYSHHLDAFVVGASVGGRTTLMFIDPETGEDLSSPLLRKGGPSTTYIPGLGGSGERVVRLFEWQYVKKPSVWNFVIVGTSSGTLLIISTELEERDGSRNTGKKPRTSQRSRISYYTKNKVKREDPLTAICGFENGLIWCSGESLYCHTLDLNEKKFKEVATYELPSFARNLEYSNGLIYALTQQHSLEVLELIETDGIYEIVRRFGDQLSRYALNSIVIDQPDGRPVHLVSDKLRCFVGLWPTENLIADTLETVFEGQLASSILKFQTTKCRPIWDPAWSLQGIAGKPSFPTSAVASQEILGLTIDGSLCRFTILEPSAWRFLRFIINLCMRSKSVCEFYYHDGPVEVEVVSEPKTMMHIDGDILQRCLRDRRLEELLQAGFREAEVEDVFSTFVRLLQGAHQGTLEKNALPGFYVAQAYADLELYLRPLL